MYTYDTLSEAINGLKARGYTEDFTLEPHCLTCGALDLQLHPEHFTIDEFYRFEGASNPSDNSIVYAIHSNEGVKGILVDAYGMYAENVTSEMAEKLKFTH